jgi:flagellar motor switch protein FliM
MAIKPFQLSLKKVSSQQQRLLEAIMSFLPKTGLRDRFRGGVEEALEKHVGEKATIRLEAVSEMTHEAYLGQLAAQPVLTVIECVPVNKKAYLEIDPMMSHLLIGYLLGSESDQPQTPRLLTDIEQGVLQYLFLQVFAHVYRLCGKEARVHFRFDRFSFDPTEIRSLASADEMVTVLTVRVQLGSHVGYAKLVLPNPLVESAYLDVMAPGEVREEEAVSELEELKRFGNFRVSMWAEAGRTTLMPSDLEQLEEEDVVLFDETDVRLEEGNAVKGRALVRVGKGEHGGFWADVSADKKAVHARLEQQFKGDSV